jgi:ribulose-5-phosphate 4-epimerase/fuculose-1-phosphate aldolase
MKLVNELIDTGKYLLKHRLAWGTSGNLSARIDKDYMIMTASGTNMGELLEDDFVNCRIDTGDWSGHRKPSKEIPMHKGIYQKRADAKAIVHSSPFYITLFTCSNEEILSDLFVETMYYLENISYIPYFHPGSEELGIAVMEKAGESNIIMMRNHGVILFDTTIRESLMRLETLEMTCKLILHAKQANVPLNRIPDKVVGEFLNNGIYKPRKNI